MNNAYQLNDGTVVRKVEWDRLWHHVYLIGYRLTWNRISSRKARAMRRAGAAPCWMQT